VSYKHFPSSNEDNRL